MGLLCNFIDLNFYVLKVYRIIIWILAFVFICPLATNAQDEDNLVFPLDNFYAKRKKHPVRGFLKDFHFGLSTGYGNTFFSHKLDGFGVFQPTNNEPRIFAAGTTPSPRYSNWVNLVTNDTLKIYPDSYLISSDSVKLGFKGHGINIPLKATIHYEFKRYRIGGGYSYEAMFIGKMRPISHQDKISTFKPDNSFGFMSKYFGMIGVSFYRSGDFLFTGDANVGGFSVGKNFDKSLIKKSVYVNVGVTVERDFSEYLRAFIRPSFELKNYTLTIPDSDKTIVHHINAFYVNIGLTFSIPELPRCYNKNCSAQINHAHGNREYRSRMHKIWKWQNPIYGQNNPNLIKYKGKNKKKLNPY